MKKTITFEQLRRLVKESRSENEYLEEIDQDFTDKVARLTDGNYHAEAYKTVALKCAELCSGENTYPEYAKILDVIGKWEESHRLASFTLRYAVEKALFEDIKNDFGQKFSDKIGQGL